LASNKGDEFLSKVSKEREPRDEQVLRTWAIRILYQKTPENLSQTMKERLRNREDFIGKIGKILTAPL